MPREKKAKKVIKLTREQRQLFAEYLDVKVLNATDACKTYQKIARASKWDQHHNAAKYWGNVVKGLLWVRRNLIKPSEDKGNGKTA
jgi:hypothetical protein